ncbi:lantibiotic dehydratase [Spirillospora sp. NBC_01491]|uniref:lantibiotic dehydratase n=1 Tax=Spirillospora sp. NBC_01491 TaxID=2976007 RepID=UPI002E32FCC4|nr:lantibiotic dehydratase [Spirillospora sp. NBC_01491]
MSENVSAVLDQGVVLSSGARVDAPPVLRVAGLPAAVLTGLRMEESFRGAGEQARLRRWLAEEGAALSDLLFAEIGALGDGGSGEGALKPRLVGLRRAVFRSRRPRPEEWNPVVAERLAPVVADRVDAWLRGLDTLERLTGALPGVLAAEIRDKERLLRAAAGRPRFRRALSQASPALSAELDKWLADPGRRPRPQTMARLAQYVARAAAKTSPYSTFTISGVGSWSRDAPVDAFASGVPVRGVLELDGFLVLSLVRELRETPALKATMQVRVNPSVVQVGDRVMFSGPPPREPIVTMPATPAVRACLMFLGEGGRYTLSGLEARLAAANRGRSDSVRRFLDALVKAGLLILDPPIADEALDPLGELADWTACGGDALVDVVPLLDRLRREVALPVPVEDVDGHCARQERLRAAAADLITRVGLPFQPVAEMSKAIFHENAVFAGAPVACSASRWRPALDDLDVVRRWLAVFDPALPLRLALGGYFRERFGSAARVPFLELCRAVHEEIARADAPDEGGSSHGREVARFLRASPFANGKALAESPLARLRELGRIQEQARREMLGPPSPDGVIRTPATILRAVASGWPDWIAPPESLGCYVQVVERERGISLALNVAHAGFGRGRSRTERLTAMAGAVLPETGGPGPFGREENGARPVYAELSGTFGSALNARAPGTRHEIDYPFTVSGRSRDDRLPVGDLEALHDPETDLVNVVSARSGERVVPLHLGMMADVLLPPIAQFLTWAFGVTYYLHPSFSPLATDDEQGVPDEPAVQPRVEAGRVILRRARWRVPTALVPAREPGENDAAYLVRLVGWLGDNGIPDRCFVRMWTDGLWSDDPSDNKWGKWVLDKSRKPIYIDFANWHLLAVFERMLRSPGPVMVFEEALPAPEDAAGPVGERAVAEFLVEISAGG